MDALQVSTEPDPLAPYRISQAFRVGDLVITPRRHGRVPPPGGVRAARRGHRSLRSTGRCAGLVTAVCGAGTRR